MRGVTIRKWYSRLALTLGALVVLASTSGAQTVDMLAFNLGPVANDGAAWVSTGMSFRQSLGVTLTNRLGALQMDPQTCEGSAINLALGDQALTFRIEYSGGYVVTGSGAIVVVSHNDLAGPESHPFGDHSFIVHGRVESVNQTKGSAWPKVGDQLLGGGEITFTETGGIVGESQYRIVRPPS